VPHTYVLSADVARCLAEAVNAEHVERERIDRGWNRSLSRGEVARISLDVLGREIRVRTVSWRLLNLVLGAVRRFGGQAADIRKTVSSFQCCHRVANPAWQWEAFSYVTSAEEGVVRRLRGAGLAATLSVAGASPGAGQDRKKG
jgi:hypothetical protein